MKAISPLAIIPSVLTVFSLAAQTPPALEVALRVLRGDGWWGARTALMDHAAWCRCAARSCDVPDDRDYDIGFRVVLAPGQ